MSDPFSIAGSAVGVISLGISVCGGLLDYYRSWKGIDDDATRICKYVDDLNRILEVLQTVVQRDEFQGESRHLIDERVISCATILRELEGVWKKFRDVPNSPRAKSRINRHFKRACYPFQEQTLSKIQSNASELRENLSLAVGILNAEIAADNRHGLAEVQSTFGQALQDSRTISRQLDDCSQNIQRVNHNVSTIQTDLKVTELSIQSQLDRVPAETAVILRDDFFSRHDLLQTQLSNFDLSTQNQQEQFEAMQSEFAALRSVILKVVSKPSLTRDVCDSFDDIHDHGSESSTLTQILRSDELSGQHDYLSRPRCTCRKTTVYNLLSYSSLKVGYEIRHLSSCPLRIGPERRIKGRLHVQPPRWILARSISATFSASFGAGGFSLEPVFVVQHVVDNRTFPSFLAIGQFHDSIEDLAENDPDRCGEEINKLLEQLTLLSKKGLCSPLLVDQYGKNILDILVEDIWIFGSGNPDSWSRKVNPFLFIIDYLLSRLNIPLTSYSIERILAHEIGIDVEPEISSYFKNHYSRSRQDDIILKANGLWVSWLSNGAYLLREWSDVIEDLKYGPVNRAVVERSASKLDASISQGHSLQEKIFNDQSALHLAAGWPLGLQRLLDAGLEPNPLTEYGKSPLDFAVKANCYESVRILIEAGSKSPSRLPDYARLPYQLYSCSEPLRRLVVLHLAQQRRDGLVEMKQKLPQWPFLEILGPTNHLVPDEAGSTFALLAGVEGNLRYFPWSTVFHDDGARYSSMTQLLFDEGFRDINSYDKHGLTPLMKACEDKSSDFIKWLLEKECDPLCFDAFGITTPFHSFAGSLYTRDFPELIPYFLSASASSTRRQPSELFWTCCHTYVSKTRELKVVDPEDYQDIFVSKYRPYEIDERTTDLEKALSPLEAASRLVSTRDRCQCACAPDGCTATTKLFSSQHSRRPFEISLRDWYLSFKLGLGDLIGMIYRDYIRLRAFEKLEITHVCCINKYIGWGLRKYIVDLVRESKKQRLERIERILEIQEEESELIERLEIFMERYDEAFAQNQGPVMEFVELWERRIEEEDEEFLWSFPLRGVGVSEISADENVNADDDNNDDNDDDPWETCSEQMND